MHLTLLLQNYSIRTTTMGNRAMPQVQTYVGGKDSVIKIQTRIYPNGFNNM